MDDFGLEVEYSSVVCDGVLFSCDFVGFFVLAMRPRLGSFAIHFGASMLVVRRVRVVMCVRAWSCWMSWCWGQVEHGCVETTLIVFLMV